MSETFTGNSSSNPPRPTVAALVLVFLASVIYAIIFNAGWRFVVAVLILAALVSVIVPYLFRLAIGR